MWKKEYNLGDRIEGYKGTWKGQINRMDSSLPKLTGNYKPKGKRDVGRSGKDWNKEMSKITTDSKFIPLS